MPPSPVTNPETAASRTVGGDEAPDGLLPVAARGDQVLLGDLDGRLERAAATDAQLHDLGDELLAHRDQSVLVRHRPSLAGRSV
jgi:hypothetical protein